MSKALAAIRAVADEWALHLPRFSQFVERVEAGVGLQVTSQPRIQGGIAIIPLIGELSARPMLGMGGEAMTASTMMVEAQFREAMRSPSVGAILFDVDSPGGTVYYTDQLARRIYDARGTKPIIAFGNGTVGSAAFWIATAADKFILAPGADAGSVGVWSAHQDMSGMMEQAGVKVTLISSGKYKTEGHPFGPLDADALGFLQSRVDQMHEEFVQALARNRGKTPNQVRKDFGEGRLFGAKEAVQRGMADDVQTVDRVLRTLAGKPAKSRLVVAEAETQEWLARSQQVYEAELEPLQVVEYHDEWSFADMRKRPGSRAERVVHEGKMQWRVTWPASKEEPPLVQIQSVQLRSATDAADDKLIGQLIEAAKNEAKGGVDPGLLRRKLALKEKEGGAARGPRTFR